jgi:hypothetical protein
MTGVAAAVANAAVVAGGCGAPTMIAGDNLAGGTAKTTLATDRSGPSSATTATIGASSVLGTRDRADLRLPLSMAAAAGGSSDEPLPAT